MSASVSLFAMSKVYSGFADSALTMSRNRAHSPVDASAESPARVGRHVFDSRSVCLMAVTKPHTIRIVSCFFMLDLSAC